MSWLRRHGYVGLVVAMSVLLAGVGLPGCSPAPISETSQQDEESSPSAAVPEESSVMVEETSETIAEPPVPTEEPAMEPVTEPEQPAAEAEQPAAEATLSDTGPSNQPAAPQVSTFAPADDLAGQVSEYVDELEEGVEDEEEYEYAVESIAKDANTLILIALALGKHDEDNKYKDSAPAIMKAAQDLAAAEDYATAQAAVEDIKAAAAGQAAEGSELQWERVASLPELMKKVPLIHTKLKRYVKGKRFEQKAEDSAGMSAVLAVIAQGSMANANDTDKPDEVEKWYKYCIQMRDSAAQVNAGIHAGDREATTKAMDALAQSCDDCHAVFHPEEASQQ
jgi:hypothetical protein